MKYIFTCFVVLILFFGCSKKSDPSQDNQQPSKPTQQEDPVKPKPEPGPLYSCNGKDQFSKIEIWWSESTPITDFYLDTLGQCQNHISSGLDIEIRYPAEGATVNVDGKSKTFWMILKSFDEFGSEHRYFQYSHFFSRTSTCSQGQFLSEDGQKIEIRMREPSARKGTLLFNNTEIQLSCPRI